MFSGMEVSFDSNRKFRASCMRFTMSLSQAKVPFSALQVVSKSNSLQHNLLPDPATPSHSDFVHKVLKQNPSVQRRARLVDSKAHFSFVTPLHLPFPYEIEPPENEEEKEVDKAAWVEKWLSSREPLEKRKDSSGSLGKYTSEERDKLPERHLIGLSKSVLEDCLPQLDVGDSFEDIGMPSLVPAPTEREANGPARGSDDEAQLARKDLVNILGGHTVLISIPGDETSDKAPYLPWSLRYCGHQFGVWAGQLGDGRAISICEHKG